MFPNQELNRATLIDDFNALRIEIPARRNWFVIGFLCFWLCGWAAGEIFAFRTLFVEFSDIASGVFLLIWLSGWTIGGAAVLVFIFWFLWGKEIISIADGVMIIEKSIRGVGVKRKYDLNAIQAIQINELMINQPAYSRNQNPEKGKIKFLYEGKVKTFAQDVDDLEAKEILKWLKGRTCMRKSNFETQNLQAHE